ncbi:MAG: methyl-accepting chemotaxis protein [Longimicrobiales bacterium]|nr:methyl-accepting chemotaxis protein [Longimicrobiales bacterium]
MVSGRFDRSFVIRTIRDFLIALTVVIAVELGGRLAVAWHDYQNEDREATQLAAERLASDVRDIMLNRGGPVAARTVYPILQRNFQAMGFQIAIVPSEVTVESIRRTQGFEPRGIQPEWPEGVHHEARVELRAEEFCTTCHLAARPGDVLGHVEVRAYRDHRMEEWLQEARVTATLGMGNVLLHSLVLFLLLRVRMEPLLVLRATVGRLARGRLDLSHRAPIRSDDEFGALACDLNEFMDRLEHLVQDLDRVLREVDAVNTRVGQVSSVAHGQLTETRRSVQQALREVFQLRDRPVEEWPASLEGIGDTLADVNRVVQEDGYYLAEIMVLEERMQAVARNGRILLERIRLSDPAPERDGEGRRAQEGAGDRKSNGERKSEGGGAKTS